MWTLLPGTHPDILGFLPLILRVDDERKIADQLNDRYAHGGGYFPMKLEKWQLNRETRILTYHDEEDESEIYQPLATHWFPLSEERAILYKYSILLILAPDGSFALTRVD